MHNIRSTDTTKRIPDTIYISDTLPHYITICVDESSHMHESCAWHVSCIRMLSRHRHRHRHRHKHKHMCLCLCLCLMDSHAVDDLRNSVTGWRRLIGSPKLQIIFHKRAIEYRSRFRHAACPHNENVIQIKIYWREQLFLTPWGEKPFHFLDILARRVLVISTTSAAPERLFSTADNVMTKKRSRLTCMEWDCHATLHAYMPYMFILLRPYKFLTPYIRAYVFLPTYTTYVSILLRPTNFWRPKYAPTYFCHSTQHICLYFWDLQISDALWFASDTLPERPHRIAAMHQYLHDIGKISQKSACHSICYVKRL